MEIYDQHHLGSKDLHEDLQQGAMDRVVVALLHQYTSVEFAFALGFRPSKRTRVQEKRRFQGCTTKLGANA